MNELKKDADFKFDLGEQVTDPVTRYLGRVISRTQWVKSCNRYSVQMNALKDCGTPHELQHFDETQLEAVN